MPKNLIVEDIKPKNYLAEDTKPKTGEFLAKRDFVYRGGTMIYRNHSLYRSNDYYRGGRTVSSDAGEMDIAPKMLKIEDL